MASALITSTWRRGFTVNFPLLALQSIRAQEAQEAAIGRSASATYRQVLADLAGPVEHR
jgi:hypothetical protein